MKGRIIVQGYEMDMKIENNYNQQTHMDELIEFRKLLSNSTFKWVNTLLPKSYLDFHQSWFGLNRAEV